MNEKYKALIETLKKGCESLKWEFSTETDLATRWDIEDGVAFTIDNIEYFAAVNEAHRAAHPNDTISYYGATVVLIRNYPHEPDCEDEQALEGQDCGRPESLAMRFIDNHWQVRRQWAAESMLYDEGADA